MVRPSVDPETLTELSGEDPPELVSPEHVDDEVGRGVDGQQHVRDGDDLLDRRCGLTGRILLEREGHVHVRIKRLVWWLEGEIANLGIGIKTGQYLAQILLAANLQPA